MGGVCVLSGHREEAWRDHGLINAQEPIEQLQTVVPTLGSKKPHPLFAFIFPYTPYQRRLYLWVEGMTSTQPIYNTICLWKNQCCRMCDIQHLSYRENHQRKGKRASYSQGDKSILKAKAIQ